MVASIISVWQDKWLLDNSQGYIPSQGPGKSIHPHLKVLDHIDKNDGEPFRLASFSFGVRPFLYSIEVFRGF